MLVAAAAAFWALWPAAGMPAGIVRAVDGRASPGARISLSGGHAIVVGRAARARLHGVVVPGALTLPPSLVGQTVTVELRLANDDEDNGQGDDDRGEDHHGGDHGGHGGGDDG